MKYTYLSGLDQGQENVVKPKVEVQSMTHPVFIIHYGLVLIQYHVVKKCTNHRMWSNTNKIRAKDRFQPRKLTGSCLNNGGTPEL